MNTLTPKEKKAADCIASLIQRVQIKMITDQDYYEEVVTELSEKGLLPKINYGTETSKVIANDDQV
ncbi:hypothetical protein [Bernardetia sp.]|uniref:hypothetical protein n=1 Tax=Bernardetia sp. TaxID=1937974 RepID=UPI0025BE5FFF|nr:hypothetical protein [Bernardetia sp.]